MCDLMRLRHAPPALCPHLEQLAQHAATNIATPTRQSLTNLNADHAPHTHTQTVRNELATDFNDQTMFEVGQEREREGVRERDRGRERGRGSRRTSRQAGSLPVNR